MNDKQFCEQDDICNIAGINKVIGNQSRSNPRYKEGIF